MLLAERLARALLTLLSCGAHVSAVGAGFPVTPAALRAWEGRLVCDLIKELNGATWFAASRLSMHTARNATVVAQSAAIVEMEMRKVYSAMKQVWKVAESIAATDGWESPLTIKAVQMARDTARFYESVRRAAVLCNAASERAEHLAKRTGKEVADFAKVTAAAAEILKELLTRSCGCVSHGCTRSEPCDTGTFADATVTTLCDDMSKAGDAIRDPQLHDYFNQIAGLLREFEAVSLEVGAARVMGQNEARRAMAVGEGAVATALAATALETESRTQPAPTNWGIRRKGTISVLFNSIFLTGAVLFCAVSRVVLRPAGAGIYTRLGRAQ
ncbi:hypothetical protein ERJ75_000469100 [Trypanosoma vivax]|nr:hypothetical protein TRVL_08692 [Trypanosoma vivax]KAH8612410.1 hypothetical protein ERJ75_000892500 [Trypanosoma vivax]KAH8616421.1 hypothetical protein ERJ75_000481100 [Trypanosoma vivax]KAH8616543.1 hypothetical protein ERJ75_000469100 [Trypanosoma vivax]